MTIKRSNYKWYILTLATFTYAILGGAERMCMPVLFPEISADLNLGMVEILAIWGMDPLAGVFVSLFAGLLVDRFGLKRTLTTVCFLAGVLGALRGLSVNLISMAVFMFMFGLLVAMTPTVVPKTTAVWFLGKKFALANSILTIGMTAGAMMGTMISATLLSPLLGGWRNVLFLYGVPPILISLLWLLTGREPKEIEVPTITARNVSFRQALLQVVHIKEIWIVGLIMMGQMGAFIGMTGYLPTYLRNIGWTPASADGAMTTLIGVSAVGAIPLALLSDRLDSRKQVLVPSLIIMTTTLGVLPLADGLAAWVVIIMNGLLRGGMFPLFTALTVERKAVGGAYAGTAIGLMTTLGMLGGAIFPPLGGSMAVINPGLPFVLWAFLSALALLGFFYVKETEQK